MSLQNQLKKLTNPFFTSRSMIKRSRLEVAVNNSLENLIEFEVSRPSKAALLQDYKLAEKINENPEKWADVSKKSLRNFAWMLLTPINGRKKALVEKADFFNLFAKELNKRKYINGWLTLYFSIMVDYPIENNYFPRILKLLKEMIKNGHTQKCIRIRERCNQFGLLEINGPELVLNYLNDKNSLEEVFLHIGLIGTLLNSRFCEQVYLQFLENSASSLSKDISQFSIIKKIISESLTLTGELKYPKLGYKLIESLLMPFAIVSVEKRCKQFIKNFLLKTFMDPRTKIDGWNGVEQRALDIFLAWMVDDTLKDFFTILKYNSHSPQFDRNWKMRRAFYKAYLDADAINEAWIVTGKDAEDYANHFCVPNMRYGKFSLDDKNDPEFSAIIIRIGNIVIVEWACVEKYRVWSRVNSNCPSFYKIFYHHDELKYSPTFEANHSGTTRGEWQDELSNYIKNNTGTALIFHEYM